MARSLFQIVPRDVTPDVRSPYYSPQRDIAYIGPGCISEALRSLDDEWHEPWLRAFIIQHSTGTREELNEELQRGAVMLAKMLGLVPTKADPVEAAKETGFDKLAPLVQVLIYARIGQVFLGGVWAGVRDVKKPGDAPPLAWIELEERLHAAYYRPRSLWQRFWDWLVPVREN